MRKFLSISIVFMSISAVFPADVSLAEEQEDEGSVTHNPATFIPSSTQELSVIKKSLEGKDLQQQLDVLLQLVDELMQQKSKEQADDMKQILLLGG
jgi:hypothetical protein